MDITKYKRRDPAWKGSPYSEYSIQKWNATKRGILFKLSFEEWCELWSEYYESRGVHGYVMCRKGDSGSYEIGNVFIDTTGSNAKQVCPKKKARANGSVTEGYVLTIIERLKKGESCASIAKGSTLSRSAITDIKFKRSWKHLWEI